MTAKGKPPPPYLGFEQGPIRPPSEARSLLIRVTRNCSWNRCRFCPVYKGSRFELRPVEHVKQDIDAVHRYTELICGLADEAGVIRPSAVAQATSDDRPHDHIALGAAWSWIAGGMRSVFIQDANSLIIRPHEFLEILNHLRMRFPDVRRVTSYARSHTIAHIREEDLKAIGEAGLNRIHIGLESGSDAVLELMRKGVTREVHIEAGRRVKRAGIELSEYVMPGLGGRDLSEEHARETADALNQIDPEFIRLRTLAIPPGSDLEEDWQAGRFQRMSDLETARELLLFIESLENITSTVKSDHILNLFQDVEGKLPEERERMADVIRDFLDMPPHNQVVYQVGRRLGYFTGPADLEHPTRLSRAESACERLGATPDNVEAITQDLMTRFI